MKNYFCVYINYIQDNWVDNLSMAKFAVNNHVNALTGIIPFFANYEFHFQTGIKPSRIYKDSKRKKEFLAADKIVRKQENMMRFLQDQLAQAQEKQAKFTNYDCQSHLEYQIEDKVYINAKHFVSKKLLKKSLGLNNAGPWEIIKVIDIKAYKVDIL